MNFGGGICFHFATLAFVSTPLGAAHVDLLTKVISFAVVAQFVFIRTPTTTAHFVIIALLRISDARLTLVVLTSAIPFAATIVRRACLSHVSTPDAAVVAITNATAALSAVIA